MLAALVRRDAAVRVFARDGDQAAALAGLGATESAVGDLHSEADLLRATLQIESVYHICPNMHADEAEIGFSLLEAARANGVRRFVYHSVLHPQTEEMAHHWQKLRVEEALFKSGLDFTILQPAPYMQNLLPAWTGIVQEGCYRIPYGAHTRLSLIDLGDVAEIGATVLLDAGHEGATYELAGTVALSQSQVAATFAQELGQPVKVAPMDYTVWSASARRNGMSDYAVNSLIAMFRYYEDYGLAGNPRVAQMLLGRPPTTLSEFVRQQL
ncbi:MAG: NmrA family NAD(P)-binding protein [Caldilineaceae bacterium]|nr:NmrA family NAD(P)-binding protein [Caldilineaceae bacterium]